MRVLILSLEESVYKTIIKIYNKVFLGNVKAILSKWPWSYAFKPKVLLEI